MSAKCILLTVFVITLYLGTILCLGEMGPGLWKVNNVKQCENPELYEMEITVERKRYNRTHDSFDAGICFPEPLNETYGIVAEIYKLCDGGYKFQQVIEDDYVCKFIEDNSKENLVKAAELANISPDCPLPAGCHSIENFIVNYEDLPEQCVYGEFLSEVYLTKAKEKILCILLEMECEEKAQEHDF